MTLKSSSECLYDITALLHLFDSELGCSVENAAEVNGKGSEERLAEALEDVIVDVAGEFGAKQAVRG